jgi:hypothetical protein
MTTQGAASASASAVLSFYTASAGLDVQNSVAKSRDDTGSESLSNDSESPEVSKYQHFVSSNLLLVCRDEEYGQPIQKVFSWIYDLRDRECKEIPDGVLEHRLLSGLLIYSQLVDTRILKLRKQLSELQINMVIIPFHLHREYSPIDLAFFLHVSAGLESRRLYCAYCTAFG